MRQSFYQDQPYLVKNNFLSKNEQSQKFSTINRKQNNDPELSGFISNRDWKFQKLNKDDGLINSNPYNNLPDINHQTQSFRFIKPTNQKIIKRYFDQEGDKINRQSDIEKILGRKVKKAQTLERRIINMKSSSKVSLTPIISNKMQNEKRVDRQIDSINLKTGQLDEEGAQTFKYRRLSQLPKIEQEFNHYQSMSQLMTLNKNSDFTNSNLFSTSRMSITKKEKLNKRSANIHEQKIKKIEGLGSKYLKDYTEFSYKIDSVLNEAYMYIKKLQEEPVKPTKFGNYD
eukprot:403347187